MTPRQAPRTRREALEQSELGSHTLFRVTQGGVVLRWGLAPRWPEGTLSPSLQGAHSSGGDGGLIGQLQLREMEAVLGECSGCPGAQGWALGCGGLVVGLQNVAAVCVI